MHWGSGEKVPLLGLQCSFKEKQGVEETRTEEQDVDHDETDDSRVFLAGVVLLRLSAI